MLVAEWSVLLAVLSAVALPLRQPLRRLLWTAWGPVTKLAGRAVYCVVYCAIGAVALSAALSVGGEEALRVGGAAALADGLNRGKWSLGASVASGVAAGKAVGVLVARHFGVRPPPLLALRPLTRTASSCRPSS